MKSVPFTAFPRQAEGRNQVNKLRRAGRVPGIVYGPKIQPMNVEVDSKAIEKLIHSSVSNHLVVDLTVEGDSRATRLALLHDVQRNPLSGKVIHADFHEVERDHKIVITVPVETMGEAKGVKTGGGTLEHVLFQVKVTATPIDLPEAIEIDVTGMEVGDTIHIGDIKAPEGVKILGDPMIPVVSVAISRTERAARLAEKKAEADAAAAPVAAGKK